MKPSTLFIFITLLVIAFVFLKRVTAPKTPGSFDFSKKDEFTIVLFGDSMVDTMKKDAPYLAEVLQKAYPDKKFNLYNYGVGAQTPEAGLARFEEPLTYKDREYPALTQLNPDIVILNSYAYNTYNPHDPQKHMRELLTLIQRAQQLDAKVYLLQDIAPLGEQFGVGEFGPNFEPDEAREKATQILEQLQNTPLVAQQAGVFMIDAYSDSVVQDGFGAVSTGLTTEDDGVHPSRPKGHTFIGEKIVEVFGG